MAAWKVLMSKWFEFTGIGLLFSAQYAMTYALVVSNYCQQPNSSFILALQAT